MENISEKYFKLKHSGNFKKKVRKEISRIKNLSNNNTTQASLFQPMQENHGANNETSVTTEECTSTSSFNFFDQDSYASCIFQLEEEDHENDNEIKEDSELQNDNELIKNVFFCEELRELAIRSNMSQNTVKLLISIINKRFPMTIPDEDPRSFLRTPKNVQLVPVGETGQYWYQGFKVCVENVLENVIKEPMTLSINVNFDGLPTFKSSKNEFWPILCNIFEMPSIRPMVIGIYCGQSKPNDLESFLNPFVQEMKHILSNGIVINSFQVTIKIRSIICDSPARAFIKGVANFNSQNGCLKCVTVGEYSYNSKTNYYSRRICDKRTDAEFRSKKYGSHHKLDSPLLQLPIDMIKDFPVADSLHLIDLGVVKRCLIGWRDGNLGSYRTKWSAMTTSKVSSFLLQCKMPAEIHRAVRGLDCLAFWKGSEFRTFFHYISLVVLKPHLPSDVYQHFLLLFCAITLCSSEQYKSCTELAHNLLIHYVEYYGDIYGEEYITSNVHNLTHLVDDVKRYGNLNTFSAYPFESKLYQIKKLLRTGNRPLAQAAKRITELNRLEYKPWKTETNEFPLLKYEIREVNKSITDFFQNEQVQYYSKIQLSQFLLASDEANKWFLTHEREVVEMHYAVKRNKVTSIYGSCLKNLRAYFESPIRSTYLNIYVSNGERKSAKVYSLNDIKCKLVSIHESRDSIVFIHFFIHYLNGDLDIEYKYLILQ